VAEWYDNTWNHPWNEPYKVTPDWTYRPEDCVIPYLPTPVPAPAPVQIPPVNLGGINLDGSGLLSSAVTKEQFERLLFILGLSDVEREFCTALGTEEDNKDTWQVYADWLEERGRTKHSKKARKKGK